MAACDVVLKAMLVLALLAAAILGALWIAFACRELWHTHTLSKWSRTHDHRRR